MIDILKINYEKFILDNGLEVVLYPDKTLPLVSVNIWYKVGSANEKNGKTGFAHLFEHMMFQGSRNVPKEMHFRYIQEAGGSLNGSTSFDRTNYYQTVPSSFLEMVLWLESDRMGYLLPALTQEKLDNQKSVVMNERRQRYENQPYGLAWEILFNNLFPEDHPYSWPTIGWMRDIENFEIEDVKTFFSTYYSPANASLVIGGDFNISKAKSLVQKYFGSIPAMKEIPEITAPSPELNDIIRIDHKDNVQLPRLYIAWHSDKLFGPEDASLDILADVLSGSKNSRLYKSLVFDKQIAQDVSAFQYSAKLCGAFIIVTTAKPGINLNTLREEIFKEITLLFKNGVTEKEIIRSKNSIKSTFIYSLQNLENKTNQINNYNCDLHAPDSFNYDLDRFGKVNSRNIIDTAKKYLEKPFTELHILPKD